MLKPWESNLPPADTNTDWAWHQYLPHQHQMGYHKSQYNGPENGPSKVSTFIIPNFQYLYIDTTW